MISVATAKRIVNANTVVCLNIKDKLSTMTTLMQTYLSDGYSVSLNNAIRQTWVDVTNLTKTQLDGYDVCGRHQTTNSISNELKWTFNPHTYSFFTNNVVSPVDTSAVTYYNVGLGMTDKAGPYKKTHNNYSNNRYIRDYQMTGLGWRNLVKKQQSVAGDIYKFMFGVNEPVAVNDPVGSFLGTMGTLEVRMWGTVQNKARSMIELISGIKPTYVNNDSRAITYYGDDSTPWDILGIKRIDKQLAYNTQFLLQLDNIFFDSAVKDKTHSDTNKGNPNGNVVDNTAGVNPTRNPAKINRTGSGLSGYSRPSSLNGLARS